MFYQFSYKLKIIRCEVSRYEWTIIYISTGVAVRKGLYFKMVLFSAVGRSCEFCNGVRGRKAREAEVDY